MPLLNGQLKPAYNLQRGVDAQYIIWLTIGPQPTATTTLIPFIKPANYEISKTRKYKTDISRRENMTYDEKEDIYWCKAGKKLTVTSLKRSKSKTGYVSEKIQHTCEDCSECEFKKQRIKGNNSKIPLEERTKRLEASKIFQKKRHEDLERILTDEGCKLCMNPSIQDEVFYYMIVKRS